MKKLALILTLTATPVFADGFGDFGDPIVMKPVCEYRILFWIWRGECRVRSFDSSDRGEGDTRAPDRLHPEPPHADDPDDHVAKSDNSDANGKGGNKHDRKDKDKHSQEIAERKKGVE